MPSLPLTKRPVDIALIIFFCVNLFFITYIVDLEQLSSQTQIIFNTLPGRQRWWTLYTGMVTILIHC